MLLIYVDVKCSQNEVDMVGQPAKSKSHHHNNHHLHHLQEKPENNQSNICFISCFRLCQRKSIHTKKENKSVENNLSFGCYLAVIMVCSLSGDMASPQGSTD